MKKERPTVVVNKITISDRRKPDLGYQEADIFFSPVDVLMSGRNLIGKVGYSDERKRTGYQDRLSDLVNSTSGGKLWMNTISIEKAEELGLVVKPASISL
jgi:hypothetical protein